MNLSFVIVFRVPFFIMALVSAATIPGPAELVLSPETRPGAAVTQLLNRAEYQEKLNGCQKRQSA